MAIRIAETKGYDSLWFSALDFRSNLFYKDKNYSSFYSDSKNYYNRALEKNDTLRKAEGGFKLGSYFLKRNILDSAFFFFYQASKDYQLLSDSVQAASNLLNMAIIQNYTRDFFGSEEISVKALTLLKNNPKPVKLLLGIYNNLGMVTRNLNRYKESVKWYEKSLSLIRNPRERMVVLNNMGVGYKFQGQFKKAVANFNEALLLDPPAASRVGHRRTNAPMPRRDDLHTILLIGSGPIVIGQGCEFDYSGAQACKALRDEGYRVVLVNSNPATIMTDPNLQKLYP